VIKGVPRFVPESNYADNFGMQWNRFAQTQLDSVSGHPITAKRFWAATGWDPAKLRGKWILDVGCGSGRFAEVASETGAQVVALDYSSAVDACAANLKARPNVHVVQGDIYSLPLAPQSFDYVYSLGVLQHTPDPAMAFSALPPMLTPGARLCVDVYERNLTGLLHPKYFFRPVTRRVSAAKLLNALQASVPPLLALSRSLSAIPFVGRLLARAIPVANYEGVLPLSAAQLREWALLDTFDWFAPRFDSPQTATTLRRWFEVAGLLQIEILKAGHLVGRGTKAL
jgi:SAM-dependent methyltransferase